MSKYLIFKTGAFGDLSFFLPAIDQIRKADSGSHITWIIGSPYLKLLKNHPGIDRLIPVNEKKLYHWNPWVRGLEILLLWLKLDMSYDQIWIGHRSLGHFVGLRFRVKGKIFQVVRKPSRILNKFREEIIVPALTLHESLAFMKMAERALKISLNPSLWKADFSWVPSILSELKKPLLIVHIGGGSNSQTEFHLKKWPHWLDLLKLILANTALHVVLVGAPQEQGESEFLLKSNSNFQNRLTSQVGKTNFLELLQLLKSADLFIGVDSGPLHFSDSMGVPSLGLYGPTSRTSWGVLGPHSQSLVFPVPCSPCYRDDGHFPFCPYQVQCMNGLSPLLVFEKIKEMLKPHSKPLALGIQEAKQPHLPE